MKWFTKSKPPLCIDCKFHTRKTSAWDGGIQHICLHPKMLQTRENLITGPETFNPCCDRSGSGCGRWGWFFEPKN